MDRETDQIIGEQEEAFETNQKKEQILKEKNEKELRQASYIKKIAYLIGIGSLLIGLSAFFICKKSEQKEKISIIKKRDEAINIDRNRLFSSITAEIKKPLAMMMAPMDRAARSIGDQESLKISN